ncbi:DUF4097 family beta strand repeat-containing protein [Nonomuraea sp. NPDC050310]|uniref:DUF4097 family beta strand repeat-containing protein n=1 Tax=Nonomuraea sp. NPDC050310 TaxID=3154935 RepID=UPI0033CE7F54
MPVYDTPEPITAAVEGVYGPIRFHAGPRITTEVLVRPGNPADPEDARAAAETRVEFTAGRLVVRRPKKGPLSRLIGASGETVIDIGLPAGSAVEVDAAGEIHTSGELGECTLTSSYHDVRVEHAAALRVSAAHGDVFVGSVGGTTTITSAYGAIEAGRLGGHTAVKATHGDVRIAETGGDLRVRHASGLVFLGRAGGDVAISTAYGDLRVAEVSGGTVTLETNTGGIEIGIAEGTAAWLDVSSGYGTVSVGLDAGDGPGAGLRTAEITARAGYGDIRVRRAP